MLGSCVAFARSDQMPSIAFPRPAVGLSQFIVVPLSSGEVYKLEWDAALACCMQIVIRDNGNK